MKIFHLLANHKFTGPADLAMVMASGGVRIRAAIVR